MNRGLIQKEPGFSLIETIAVVAIMGVIIALATPGFLGITRSFTLTTAGQDVRNIIAIARQEATSRNRPVEVRFCRLKGDTPLQHVQIVGYETDGTVRILSHPVKLPQGLYIDTASQFSKDVKLSTLFDRPNAAQGAKGNSFAGNANSLLTLPGAGSSYEVFSFFILPDGSSSLEWNVTPFPCVTIRNDPFNPGVSSVPQNYATIQIDPVNCRTTLLRP